jgi:hypothetical protein
LLWLQITPKKLETNEQQEQQEQQEEKWFLEPPFAVKNLTHHDGRRHSRSTYFINVHVCAMPLLIRFTAIVKINVSGLETEFSIF